MTTKFVPHTAMTASARRPSRRESGVEGMSTSRFVRGHRAAALLPPVSMSARSADQLRTMSLDGIGALSCSRARCGAPARFEALGVAGVREVKVHVEDAVALPAPRRAALAREPVLHFRRGFGRTRFCDD